MPELSQTGKDALEDAEIRYAMTLSKEIQEKVRGRECAQMTGEPVINYLSFCQLEYLKPTSSIDQSRKLNYAHMCHVSFPSRYKFVLNCSSDVEIIVCCTV